MIAEPIRRENLKYAVFRRRPKTTESAPPPVMPGLEPGIQAAPSVVILRISALDGRIKSAHDEAESAAFVFGRHLIEAPDFFAR
jgi:hypothetical protein